MLPSLLPTQTTIYYEDNIPIIFKFPSPILFSELNEQHLGLTLEWNKWKLRIVELRSDGSLVVRKISTDSIISPIKYKYDLTDLHITQMGFNSDISTNKDIGIVIKARTIEGHHTQFRLISTQDIINTFYFHLKKVVIKHNIDHIRQDSITSMIQDSNPTLGSTASNRFLPRLTSSSIMRSSIAFAMDRSDNRSKKQRILDRRGALAFLPVYFANDLVHGSLWFVIGSFLFVISSLMIFINSFYEYMGDDDSILSPYHYRASWLLMIISGVIFTIGSFAFVRAVHEDPPMKPLFPDYYHIQSDELLASWLFLIASLPVIPYTLIYIGASDGDTIYWIGFVVAIILVIGTALFVRSCYPNTKMENEIIIPVFHCMFCLCCSRDFMDFHMANDWLAGTWFMFWGTTIAFVLCCIMFLYYLIYYDVLMLFMIGTALIENACFLIGSAYFVSGSYPEYLVKQYYKKKSMKKHSKGKKSSMLRASLLGNDSLTSSSSGSHDIMSFSQSPMQGNHNNNDLIQPFLSNSPPFNSQM